MNRRNWISSCSRCPLVHKRSLLSSSILTSLTAEKPPKSEAENITEGHITDNLNEEPSSDHDINPIRGLKKPPQPRNYLILNARASSILPRRAPPTSKPQPFQSELLDAQLKKLLVFQQDAPKGLVLESINQLRPSTNIVSNQRYHQLFYDMLRAYSSAQLRDFLKSVAKWESGYKSISKKAAVEAILKKFWHLAISDSISESSDVIIEKVIDLSRRDLFLIVSRNGRLAREWTKSGAKIAVLASEQKIVVRSTSDTYEWIMASMLRELRKVETLEIDLEPLKTVVDIDTLPLGTIQQMSDAFIERKDETKFVASSFGHDRLQQLQRMLVDTAGLMFRTEEAQSYDMNPDNIANGIFSADYDDVSLPWKLRGLSWCRWQLMRPRIPSGEQIGFSKPSSIDPLFDVPVLSLFDSMSTNDRLQPKMVGPKNFQTLSAESVSISDIAGPSSITEISRKVSKDLIEKFAAGQLSQGPEMSLTLAATFGHLLHDTSPENSRGAIIPRVFTSNLRPSTTFSTNIPKITQVSKSLPLWEESPSSADMKESQLFVENFLEMDETVATDRHTYFVQIKFVPSPFSNKGIDWKNMPSVEMWLEMDNDNVADPSTVKVHVVEKEVIHIISIAECEADVRFSGTLTWSLKSDQKAVTEFLDNSILDFSGKVPVKVANGLTLEIDGQNVDYMYQHSFYRKQLELDYKSRLLQFSVVEGGQVAGRRVEANLIHDCEQQGFDSDEVEKFLQDSFSFVEKLR